METTKGFKLSVIVTIVFGLIAGTLGILSAYGVQEEWFGDVSDNFYMITFGIMIGIFTMTMYDREKKL